jgi:hypothetical protein
MCDGTKTESTEMTGNDSTPIGVGSTAAGESALAIGSGAQTQEQDKTFTQAEVDRIVKQRAERLAKEQYPDYEELKAKAAGAKTLEERLGSLEQELSATKAEALRSSIAARFGISTEKGKDDEPSDADLFLTGTDESTLTAQAQRLAARQADSKKQGNVAPKEGATTTTGKDDTELREFARGLFGQAD